MSVFGHFSWESYKNTIIENISLVHMRPAQPPIVAEQDTTQKLQFYKMYEVIL